MFQKADADTQAEIRRLVLPALRVEDVPSDMVPIKGSFHDAKDRVSLITRVNGRVVAGTDTVENQHPHERKDPVMNPRPPRRLPLGEKFS
jgi:hypothetical protein